jgi:hypothetical protein
MSAVTFVLQTHGVPKYEPCGMELLENSGIFEVFRMIRFTIKGIE